jgi:hypothetical protein
MVLPLLSYGFIAWRAAHPVAVQWPILEPGWHSLRDHVLGRQYRTMFGHFRPSVMQQQLLVLYVYPFLWPGLAALVFAFLQRRKASEHPIRLALLAAASLQTAVAFGYGVADPSAYFLVPMALGLVTVPSIVAECGAGGAVARRATAVGVCALGLVGVLLIVPWSRTAIERRAAYVTFEATLREMWDAIPAQRGFVFWADDAVAHLRVFQLLEGEKPELETLHPFILTHPRPRARIAARFGFDPLAGLQLPGREMLTAADGPAHLARLADEIEHNVNRQTDLPVIVIEPSIPSVRLLIKPGARPDSSATAVTAPHNR